MSAPQAATADSTLIIALISLTASLLTTIIALLGKSYADSKRDDKRKTAQHLEYINSKVYSPLLFSLFEAQDNLSFLAGCLEGFIETKEYNGDENRRLIIQELNERYDLHSTSIREILFDKIALINPQRFRQQLFFFLQYLKMYEVYVKQFTDTGFRQDFIEQDLKFIENLWKASFELSQKTALFVGYIDILIQRGEKAQAAPEIFTNKDMQRLSKLITSRNILISEEVVAKGLLKKD
jgi:hypothetical protein